MNRYSAVPSLDSLALRSCPFSSSVSDASDMVHEWTLRVSSVVPVRLVLVEGVGVRRWALSSSENRPLWREDSFSAPSGGGCCCRRRRLLLDFSTWALDTVRLGPLCPGCCC